MHLQRWNHCRRITTHHDILFFIIIAKTILFKCIYYNINNCFEKEFFKFVSEKSQPHICCVWIWVYIMYFVKAKCNLDCITVKPVLTGTEQKRYNKYNSTCDATVGEKSSAELYQIWNHKMVLEATKATNIQGQVVCR